MRGKFTIALFAKVDEFDEAQMNSLLQTSASEQRSQIASVVSGVFVHSLVVGLLLLVAAPVWKSSEKRTVTRITAPPPKAKSAPVARIKVRRPVAPTPLPALETAVIRRSLTLPAVATKPRLRIEAPPEIAAVQAAPLPSLTPPTFAIKPVVQVGLLDTPAATSAPQRLAAASSGFDSDPVSEKAGGGRQVSGAGFDGTVASGPAKGRPLATASFDATEAPTARVAKNTQVSFEGIEILEKPQPAYTEEARRLRIEGTVRLRVVFGAAGQIRVLSVVQGLGHGLDEAAIQAAEAIRFRPARRDGRPVDAPAVIQIQFQIA